MTQMRYSFHFLRDGICVSIFALSLAVRASDSQEPAYFIYEGNPVSVKYASGRLVQIPIQDAYDVESLKNLEAVSALLSAPRLSGLIGSAQPLAVKISTPRLPEYGVAMFDVTTEPSKAQKTGPPPLVWSGTTSFREIELRQSGLDARQKQRLIDDSRHVLSPTLDLRNFAPVGRRIKIDGPVSVRSYGRTDAAPYLAFVDITWRIKNLPESLSDHGIDSWSPFFRVEYVVNSRTGKAVYRNVTNVGGIEDRDMRLFKEREGPLLMAVTIACTDGDEPLIIDLENETFGTGQKSDVTEVEHCFPAQ